MLDESVELRHLEGRVRFLQIFFLLRIIWTTPILCITATARDYFQTSAAEMNAEWDFEILSWIRREIKVEKVANYKRYCCLPPQTSIFMSYLPSFSKYALLITKRPPAIIGVWIGDVGSFCLICLSCWERYSHLNTRFQSNPPRKSADAPMYWNVSIEITSMTGQTTRVSSSATLSISAGNQSSLHSQWLSRNVRIGAEAISAPRTLDLTRPSLFSLRITRTLFIFANSRPSSAVTINETERLMLSSLGFKTYRRLTVIWEVID